MRRAGPPRRLAGQLKGQHEAAQREKHDYHGAAMPPSDLGVLPFRLTGKIEGEVAPISKPGMFHHATQAGISDPFTPRRGPAKRSGRRLRAVL